MLTGSNRDGATVAHLLLAAVAIVFGLGMLALVVGSLIRPEVSTYAPTQGLGVAAAGTLVGPITYTVDARDQNAWRFFDFSSGSVVQEPEPLGWDLAIRRHTLIVNGGFPGRGGIVDLGPARFDTVHVAPAQGYLARQAGSDTAMPGLGKWYEYGFFSHVLTPKPHVYVVRTADGRYAKLEILSYYCDGGASGCMTFRYVYQGNGSRRLGPITQE